MKTLKIRVLTLVLALAMLLSGCTVDLPAYLDGLVANYAPVHFSDMVYVRPDMTELQASLDALMESVEQPDFAQLERDLFRYGILYQDFYTNYSLANIHYSMNLTDIYWTDEYNFCSEQTAQVDAGMDQLMYALADSVHRETLEGDDYYGEGYFDDYEGDSIYDEYFTSLMDQETALVTEYYDLSAQAVEVDDDTYYNVVAPQMCQLYVDLVVLRQEIARYAGYESYPAFAYEFYYGRDYTPAQETAYLAQVRQELVPLYRNIYTYGVAGIRLKRTATADTFAYVEQMAKAMGGEIQEAFTLLKDAGLYTLGYSDNKFNASFETFLSLYNEPYIFMNPTASEYDYLTFAHEFGHFCNDFAANGSSVTIDVAEIFSQGMEYLSFSYVEAPKALRKYKMVNSLSVFVEQSGYADFEQRVYAMDPEELTVENVFALFEQVGSEYGFDLWGVEGETFVGITHFFTSPCYVFSYVVSNDAAIQFYQLEQEERGKGLALMQEHLATEEACFLAFLESAGLQSPFDEGRIQAVRDTLAEALGY